MKKSHAKKDDLEEIPGIGVSIAEDFREIGIFFQKDLKNKDPEKIYDALCKKAGVRLDRCLLYVCRCAVYFTSHSTHRPELLKWWHWKDDK